MSKLVLSFFNEVHKEQSRIILWMPIFFMVGIFLYFSLSEEPSFISVVIPFSLSILLVIIFFKHPILKMVFMAIFFMFFGFSEIFFKTYYLNTPLLKEKLDNQTIKGIIVEQEYTPEKASYKIVIDLTPYINKIQRIKVTLKDTSLGIPEVGDKIEGVATLLPFSDPVSLFSYDFRRAAYFAGISASGTISTLKSLNKCQESSLKKTRNHVTDFIRQKIKGQAGEIAIAVTTGYRNGITNEVRQDFANSGLSHILAISGLHISLVAGLIFLVFRRFLACIPPISKRYNTKKMACFLSIPAIYYYVALSGYGYPAIRSFYMTSLIFISVILDRQPLSIRSIALAAFLILLVFPESATSVSFELSFAAVLGLIAFYEKPWWSLKLWSLKKNKIAKYFVYVLGVTTTTFIATLSTTPISLYYFNQYTLNAVFANIIAIPLTGIFIMPLATLSILSYFTVDCDWIFDLWAISVEALIYIAKIVSHWPGSNLKIAQPSTLYAFLFGLGFLWVCLFTTKMRHIGYVFIFCAFLSLLDKTHLPDIYMANDGSVMAYVKNKVFYVTPTKGTKGSFYYTQWRQEQGVVDHSTWTIEQPFSPLAFVFNPWEMDKKILKNIECPSILLTNGYIKKCFAKSATLIDRSRLKKDGTHLIWLNPFKIKTVKQSLGNRPWVIQ
ncbi:MAG: hypothetical protein HEEMFOPI_00784 [Holosporales bacterium]